MKVLALILIWCVESVHRGINKLTPSFSYTQEKFLGLTDREKLKNMQLSLYLCR